MEHLYIFPQLNFLVTRRDGRRFPMSSRDWGHTRLEKAWGTAVPTPHCRVGRDGKSRCHLLPISSSQGRDFSVRSGQKALPRCTICLAPRQQKSLGGSSSANHLPASHSKVSSEQSKLSPDWAHSSLLEMQGAG